MKCHPPNYFILLWHKHTPLHFVSEQLKLMRFEVFMVMTLKTSVFWDDNASSNQVYTQQDIIFEFLSSVAEDLSLLYHCTSSS